MRPVPLRDAREAHELGGKAVALGTALRAGLPVPDGFALPVALVDAVSAGDTAARAAVRVAYAQLACPVAARSSAIGEDSQGASFAGQHVSLLNVTSSDALLDAIATVRASAHTPAALAYRAKRGIAGAPRIAVIVQRLVHAEAAGVLFTRDPVTGRDECVIESAWGLGEAVVSGLVTPDRYRLDHAGRVVERALGDKDVMIVAREGGGTEEVAVEDARVSAGLTDAQLRALHELAARCAAVYGDTAHDLEWAFSDATTLHLLQRRPITRHDTRHA